MRLYGLKRKARLVKHYLEAAIHAKRSPAPYFVKHGLLVDFFPAKSTVIETGTYLGETTQILANHCKKVVSLEPFIPLYKYNCRRFADINHIQIVNGSSEEKFGDIIEALSGDLSFWLDGHYSGDGTHGQISSASPIVYELEQIGSWLEKKRGSAFIAIDDARLFTGDDGYPDRNEVISFAIRHDLQFFELRDIFFIEPRQNNVI